MKIQKALLERNLVVVLFILVLVVFSFAERDTRKLEKLYNKSGSEVVTAPENKKELTGAITPSIASNTKRSRN